MIFKILPDSNSFLYTTILKHRTMVDFNNTEVAFRSKTTSYLRKSKLLFRVMQNPNIVRVGKTLYFFAAKIHFPTDWIIRPTVYDHFVGGATLESCLPTVKNLLKFKVKSILDYSAEGASGEKGIKQSFDETIRSIDYAAKTHGVAYAVFKPSAISYPKILEKFNFGKPTTDEDRVQYDKYVERMDALAEYAYKKGIRLLVDAEHYAYQKCIDEVVESLMEKYNKERVVVFNTLQMYRHDRFEYLVHLHQDAKLKGYKVGVKFVRGAYMEEERELAKIKGYEDPICRNKVETDTNYDKGVDYCMQYIDDFEVFCGTHNMLSCQKLVNLFETYNIPKNDERIYFSQLYGMSDNLTYNLAHAGYNAVKYVPYAPIKSVMPYLLRRASENTSIEGQTNRELELIKSELKRRRDNSVV